MQLFNVNNELKTSHYSSIKRKRKKKEIVEFLSRWEKKSKKEKEKEKESMVIVRLVYKSYKINPTSGLGIVDLVRSIYKS